MLVMILPGVILLHPSTRRASSHAAHCDTALSPPPCCGRRFQALKHPGQFFRLFRLFRTSHLPFRAGSGPRRQRERLPEHYEKNEINEETP